MDPNTTRERIIEKANFVLGLAAHQPPHPIDDLAHAAVDLSETVHDLDTWLRAGGFLPDAWTVAVGGRQDGRHRDVDI